MTEQNDDRFDAFVRDAAREYNRPPATPRDEMWSAITAARRSRAVELKTRRRWISWSAGIAAVLAIGIGIGRMTVTPGKTPVSVAAGDYAVADPAATYRAVAGDHFGRVETLLTMFRAEARTGRPDDHVTTAARSLLGTNRLLLDSPVATDPRMRQLLEDLELVLAQIAQLSAEQGMDPTQLIVKALEDNSVLLRLRSAVPAGQAVGGPQGAL